MTISRMCITVSMALLPALTLGAENYQPPRTATGKPDLQGYWSNASLTRMTRPRDFAELVIPADQVPGLTAEHPQNVRQATDDGLVPGQLLDGSDLAQGRGYNAFWVDPGTSYGVVRGSSRTSWIVEPDDGQIPWSEAGRVQRDQLAVRFSGTAGPEARALGERCLIATGNSAGPPMNNTLYNNHYQFVQTDDYLLIMVEMVHDVRIIPIDRNHRPEGLQQWFGDSVGWWEGDSLVVETVNMHPQLGPRNSAPLSTEGKVIEKFTRYSDSQILYEFEVIDPVYYAQSWRGEMSFNAMAEGEVPYEFACHEGNYALPGILAGERRLEVESE